MRLECLVRLRHLGVWPWLVFGGWIVVTAAQEPRLLRSFEIQIVWQGAWGVGAILVLAAGALGSSSPHSGGTGSRAAGGAILRYDVLLLAGTGLALTVLVGIAQALLAWLPDVFLGGSPPFTAVAGSAGRFVLALLPASLATVLLVPLWPVSIAARVALLGVVGFSLGNLALWFRGGVPVAGLASALASACPVLTARFATSDSFTRSSTPHAYRHPR